jgi:transposase
VRDLARKRIQLVRSSTTHILAVENIMARQLGGRMTSNDIKRLTVDAIDKLPLSADVTLAIKANGAVIATLAAQIDMLEKRLKESVRPRPEYRLLTTVPGIGKPGHRPSRNLSDRAFRRSRQLCFLCALC